ncbi:sulfate adenylyltransferase subunit CysN [Flammeovirgaceae bacterium SG7u.111]|nr:sulfate adenylyltransferase subunit CysN [Flammeovirgaceae bacterium SG7u.132]WPO38445.1 sulfate adenylyltransferase subunit CysN [Flammeovirgaceae bacterium SG7u.111]
MIEDYANMELLRFTTAGSVDDGKSTLIGRLLYDSKSIFEDQIAAVKTSSEKKGLEHIDLSLLTDGLKAEREQGITIDVAYRYFATPKRKFIIADTPGHVQYTRNMVTGASTANLALVLVDARHGIVEQTNRHAFIASLLKIPHLVVCINKMDLVDYDQDVYEKIVEDFKRMAGKLDVKDISYIPMSALNGDNVVDRSENMKWYDGSTLLHLLEHVHIASDTNHLDIRLPVQYVIRPHSEEYHDFRGYAGRLAGGILTKGKEVTVLPSGFKSKIKSITDLNGELDEAFAPMSVTVELEDDIDISRGDMLVNGESEPFNSQDIEVMLCWLNPKSPAPRTKFVVKHTTREVKAMIKEVVNKIDIETLENIPNPGEDSIKMNDIVRVKLRTTQPLFFDVYKRNRTTGSLIMIDDSTNETVAAGMIVSSK